MMKRPCALKQIRHDKATDRGSLARFEREVRATSRLSHPNTIEIYDFGRADDGTFYYVMEYLPGMSLADILDRHGPMPPGRVIYLLRQACGALAEAHSSGLIHRDLKPANIFAARRGGKPDVAKVLDFGLVKDLEADANDPRVSREHTVQGTPNYMAPEQVLGLPGADHRIDLYAMGCIAYTLLTGRPPFDEGSGVAVMMAHARAPVEPPSKYRPDLPDDLERVILRCLEKSPDARYPDAEALGRALGECASASEWDDREAERWWREFEPESFGLPLAEPEATGASVA
jgi:serine/threonine-protein kinase